VEKWVGIELVVSAMSCWPSEGVVGSWRCGGVKAPAGGAGLGRRPRSKNCVAGGLVGGSLPGGSALLPGWVRESKVSSSRGSRAWW